MRNLRSWLTRTWIAAALVGCHLTPNHVDGGVLGRVVVYRNGVAFYERHATVEDGTLTVHVPRDRVDDFLKSLTVVDPFTRKPLAVTIPRKEADGGSYLSMTLETPGVAHAEVLLTYVTEAPAWKPSYRVVVGDHGKVMLEGWAIVDNTTTEDWKGVLVGVGASSALAFRYDLWSVRQIDRDLLQGEDRFAIAPPAGVSPYAGDVGQELARLDTNEVRGDAVARRGDVRKAEVAKAGQGDALGGSSGGATSTENVYVIEGKNTSDPATGEHGTLQGEVVDQKTGEKLPGVTVVATSTTANATATALTDENGRYQIDLPRGTYAVTFYYGDTTAERPNVTVALGKTTSVVQKLKQDGVHGETITITGTAPIIDQGSTKVATTITQDYLQAIPGRVFDAGGERAAGAPGAAYEPPSPIKLGDDKLKAVVDRLKQDRKDVVIEVHGPIGSERRAASLGVAVKNKLVDDGVPATRIHIVPKLGPSEPETVRVVAVAPAAKPAPTAPPAAVHAGPDTPVGESHFMADRPMTVRAGTSAMVAMVHGETTGGVVYLYDPISERGDPRFAFKSVRLDNPTADTLEPGPVTVYGDGRFIGEGITEPVPPKQAVVVPFALDRQIIVERNGAQYDRIAKLVTVQRGIVTAEVQHRRQTRFTITSRLHEPSTVYLRHRLEPGWALVESPAAFTRVGDSQLFQVDVDAGQTKYVTIAEGTPVQRTMALSSEEALDLMQLYVSDDQPTTELKGQLAALLATHRGAADLGDKIATLRDQLAEYRMRSGELHAQLVTLKAVKTGGALMQTLRNRLAEVSDRVQQITIEIVDIQEQLMLAR
ncbi:MAG TPA: carboxypeptidase regulatory-like domain-containing protein, partial [Kofleriaceae bacterium]|nr:carboxypeptidase regulatory-like domain-containing protein [Kofleriaceae bacterium]